MSNKDLKELGKFFDDWKIINYNDRDDFINNWKSLNTNFSCLSDVHSPLTDLINDYRTKGTGLPEDAIQSIFNDLRKKIVIKSRFADVQNNLTLLVNFHNFENMMSDYANKSENHAFHGEKMKFAIQLLNFGWRDNFIE